MAITDQVRAYAAAQGLGTEDAVAAGMAEKSAEFVAAGGDVYLDAPTLRPGSP
jgi:phosphomethylpyrimidine synthase